MTEPAIIETAEQAREGETSGHMRWVLLWSVALSIAAIAIAGLAIVG
ncbi:hypothetical protein SAMN05216360_101480 [Methylobacterium phyllostachyos]|uniref:Uncharacterized protein n=1 Tax=Methylobacterium phyllostachyos TaxID=582672 RepID=A0A1G9S3H8_9HYPH|nr:hypothetical protein [Methylobacterium phyllostachyos]SDM30053.1 hypothetical protein SAMN05216360_101480 [Methylobacterium phyllostachyos]